MRNPTRVLAGFVGLVFVAFVALLAFGGGDDADSTSRLLGERVPVLTGEVLVSGDFPATYDIDDSRGHWVVVNFFASWCPPCVAEHPELIKLQEWGEASDTLDVVAVVFNDKISDVTDFFVKHGGEWPVVDDPGLAIDFQISAVPETFLIDPNGVVRVHYTGGIRADQIIETITGE